MENELQNFDIKTTTSGKRRKPINWGAVTFVAAHLLPAFIMVAIFYVYCNIESFFMAFQRRVEGGIDWTMENFEWLFKQFGAEGGLMQEALLNTLMWRGIQLFLIVFGLFTSYFIYKKITGSKLFRVYPPCPSLLFIPYLTDFYSKTFLELSRNVQSKNPLNMINIDKCT